MIAVTGATGHLGNVLVRELVSRGEQVRVIIPPFEDTKSLEGMDVERVEGDVLNFDSLMVAFEGADVVYHLAGIVAISPRKQRMQYQINIAGTRNVVEACLKSGVNRLVHTSSIQALVEPPNGTVFDEADPFDPNRVIGHYAKSKAQGSLEVLSGVERGLDAVIVCPTGATGPYDFKPSQMGNWFADLAKDRISGRMYIGGAYDFVDVRDIAVGHILACEKGRKGEAYILSGERITEADLSRLVQQAAGASGRIYRIPQWIARMMAVIAHIYGYVTDSVPQPGKEEVRILSSNSFISHEKATRELGYAPRTLRESVADTIRWFGENGRL
jgi:dihydroflavonol-4-reductase